jgi:predicted nucleic acid-binding protein
MKITVDTNVLISATFWYGDSYRIIEAVEHKKLTLVLSENIIEEYRAVLGYEEIQ